MLGRVLPAYAGMIPGRGCGSWAISRAPRVCGDDPDIMLTVKRLGVCSPRMRG